MGLPLLPEIIDQYLELVESWDSSEDSPVPFITRLSRKGPSPESSPGRNFVTYSLILQLILALNQDDARIVRDYLLQYGPDIAGNVEYYELLIEDALAYYREVLLPSRKSEEAGHDMDEALRALRDLLAKLRDSGVTPDADSLQTEAFQVSKDRNLKMKDWFRTLYRVFLGQSQGPRIGSFSLLGFEKTIERLDAHLGGG